MSTDFNDRTFASFNQFGKKIDMYKCLDTYNLIYIRPVTVINNRFINAPLHHCIASCSVDNNNHWVKNKESMYSIDSVQPKTDVTLV